MYLPLRIKFLLVAAGVAVAALGSALWAVNYQLESRMAAQIATMLTGAESTFITWKGEQEKHLQAEARIVAHDPRFFAAVAEGDEATTEPTAREFQEMAGSDIFLVCDRKGRRLAYLGTSGSAITLDWPAHVPPQEESVRWDGKLYLLKSQALTVGPDTIGYVALGLRVDEELAQTMGRVAGADVLFFDNKGVFGSTLSTNQSLDYVRELKSRDLQTESPEPELITVSGERILCRVGRLGKSDNASYAVIMSLDERLEPQIADLRSTMLWVGSLALLFAFAVSWSVARRVTARVPQLVAAVEAVSHGNYDKVVRHEGHDELRAVADAVDRMRHDLAAQIEAIKAANDEKIASERLAVVGKMSSTIIHDFKTPMQVIRTAVELSSGADVRQEKREHYAQMIMRELDRMVNMAHDLLSFARGERRMNRTEVDTIEFLDLAVNAWRQICSAKGIQLTYECPTASTRVAIDQDKIRRALDNIVINATEAMANGGVLTVSCRPLPHDVEIAVRDTGPGIPVEIQSAIFEPFATFGKAKGSGLGLAMAKKAVEDHGGRIALDSAPGTGTTFTITLPIGPGSGQNSPAMEGKQQHATALA
jgi:signal transduction histidine kinase